MGKHQPGKGGGGGGGGGKGKQNVAVKNGSGGKQQKQQQKAGNGGKHLGKKGGEGVKKPAHAGKGKGKAEDLPGMNKKERKNFRRKLRKNEKKGGKKGEKKEEKTSQPVQPSLVSLSSQNWLKVVGQGKEAIRKPEARKRRGKSASEDEKAAKKPNTTSTSTSASASNTTGSKGGKGGKNSASGSGGSSSSAGKMSKYVALDCEMVGVNGSKEEEKSILARCSLVDYDGNVLYDKFVQPKEKVINYRTFVSGVREEDLRAENGAVTLEDCRNKVGNMLKGKVLVGHALKNDLDALLLTHPGRDVRDTARYKPFMSGKRARGLKKLVKEKLGMEVQDGEHSSVEDARATMALFKSVQKEWEKGLGAKKVHSHSSKNDGKKKKGKK